MVEIAIDVCSAADRTRVGRWTRGEEERTHGVSRISSRSAMLGVEEGTRRVKGRANGVCYAMLSSTVQSIGLDRMSRPHMEKVCEKGEKSIVGRVDRSWAILFSYSTYSSVHAM